MNRSDAVTVYWALGMPVGTLHTVPTVDVRITPPEFADTVQTCVMVPPDERSDTVTLSLPGHPLPDNPMGSPDIPLGAVVEIVGAEMTRSAVALLALASSTVTAVVPLGVDGTVKNAAVEMLVPNAPLAFVVTGPVRVTGLLLKVTEVIPDADAKPVPEMPRS
jgi:hypothetical protein